MADAFVARWFPKKHQLVTATLAGYAGLYGLYRMMAGNPKPLTAEQKRQREAAANPPPAGPGPTAAAEGGFQGPSMDTLDQWLQNPDNLKRAEEWISKPGSIEEWSKTLK